MSDPSPGDSSHSISTYPAKELAGRVLLARALLDRACVDGIPQGLDPMAQELFVTLKEVVDLLERVQRSFHAAIIKEQARGAGDHYYVPAMTVDCPFYRENHMTDLGNEVEVILSVISHGNDSDAGIDPPDQALTSNWTAFNEKYSEKVEYRPDNEEAPGSGGSRSVHYYKCTYNGCPSKPLKYRSKLRCVFLMYRREPPPPHYLP